MQEIRNDTKQIIMTEEERLNLYKEFERAFVRLDTESPKGMFSPEVLSKNYPLMIQLFRIVDLR